MPATANAQKWTERTPSGAWTWALLQHYTGARYRKAWGTVLKTRGREGLGLKGPGHKPSVLDCLPLAAPIGLSPLLILTLCGPERVLVVSTEPPDDLSCWTTPGVGRPGDGAVARAGDQVHPDAHSESVRGFADSSTDLCALGGGGYLRTRCPPPPPSWDRDVCARPALSGTKQKRSKGTDCMGFSGIHGIVWGTHGGGGCEGGRRHARALRRSQFQSNGQPSGILTPFGYIAADTTFGPQEKKFRQILNFTTRGDSGVS